MKQLLLITILVLPSLVSADEFIQMSNGMTCWRNSNGHTYGCSGGTSTGDSGFNDVRTGERYEYTGGNQSINTRTGRFMNTPQRNNNMQNERNNNMQNERNNNEQNDWDWDYD